jgi:hypothetical protein
VQYLLKTIIVIGLVATSCNHHNRISIEGQVADGEGNMIHLQELFQDAPKNLEMATLKRGGRFSFQLESKTPMILGLVYANQLITLVAHPGEKITVQTTHGHFSEQYLVAGSRDSERAKLLNDQWHSTHGSIDSLRVLYASAVTDEEKTKYEERINEQFMAHKKNLISHILSDMGSLSNIVALYQKYDEKTYFLGSYRDIQYYKIVNDSLSKHYPNLSYVKTLSANTAQLLGRYNQTKILSQTKEIKNTIPNISLPNAKGDTLQLEHFKDQYTLLFFWSPDIKDNRTLSRQFHTLYQKYQPQGFEVFQVALKNDLEAWKKIVNFDETPWKTVCDTRAGQSPYLGIYNITSLPTTYLVGPGQEDILGKNLSIRQLDLKLNYLFNEK